MRSDRISVDIHLTQVLNRTEVEGLLRDLWIELGYCSMSESQRQTSQLNHN
jgi:hypothetical protein